MTTRPSVKSASSVFNGSSDRGPTRPATLSEPTLFYAPPYACPLTEAVAWNLVKYLQPIAGLQADVALSATTTVDFLIEAPGHRVGVVLNSAATDVPALPDGLDVLVSIDGSDLLHYVTDAIYLMAASVPGLFSARGRLNLHQLASPEACAAAEVQPHQQPAEVVYPAPEEEWELDGEKEMVAVGPPAVLRVDVTQRPSMTHHTRRSLALALQ